MTTNHGPQLSRPAREVQGAGPHDASWGWIPTTTPLAAGDWSKWGLDQARERADGDVETHQKQRPQNDDRLPVV